MTDYPILFSPAMLRALLEGRKTQTRRLPWRECKNCVGRGWVYTHCETICCPWCDGTGRKATIWQKLRPGDRLWLRETWWHHKTPFIEQAGFEGGTICLLDDGPAKFHRNPQFRPSDYPEVWRKRVSIHMPRWASRLTLEVTETRMERVQDISEEDAEAEGMAEPYTGDGDPPFTERSVTVTRRMQFRNTWNQLHGAAAWDRNEEVVPITFTVHDCNIDKMERTANDAIT